MIKKLLICSLLCVLAGEYKAQCSVSSAPVNDCTYGDQFNSFILDGIAAVGNSGCGSNGYNAFTSPVWTITAGFTYTWAAVVGSGNYNQGVAIWIDYDNNGMFDNYEQVDVSPAAFNHQSSFTVPMTVLGGPTKMRIRCAYNNNNIGSNDACTNNLSGYGETEDYDVHVIPPPPCSSTPSSNTVTVPSSSICPGASAGLFLSYSYSVSNLVYQWYSSTVSAVGLWNAIPNATLPTLSTPGQTVNTWYQLVIGCGVGGTQTTSAVGLVAVSPVITSVVPYLEDFEGITSNDELPNCSWSASNISNVNQTYTNTQSQNRVARSGNKFASFVAAYQSGTSYFYSNGIQLNVGVTYSASVWYTTDFSGSPNVTEFALQYGTTQSNTGLTNIASHSPAVSAVYKQLSNTFQVPSSGIYYIAVKATSNGNYGADYLSWDDLEITVPCSLNAPSVAMSVDNQTICAGEEITLTGSGADTYTWSNGATGASATDSPAYTTLYSLTGENTASGCQLTTPAVLVTVNSKPNLFAYATTVTVCQGDPVTLVANGAASYSWSPINTNNPLVTVHPTVSTSYVVMASNTLNCTNSKTIAVTVYTLPLITVSGPSEICQGEKAVLAGSGAATYQFASNANFISGSPVTVNPKVTTTYTVYGTSLQGCTNKTTTQLTVNECLGVNEVTNTLEGVRLYPNPTSGVFTVELRTTAVKTIQLTDISGRVVMSSTSSSEKINLNTETLANGIYYVRVQSNTAAKVIKLVKN